MLTHLLRAVEVTARRVTAVRQGCPPPHVGVAADGSRPSGERVCARLTRIIQRPSPLVRGVPDRGGEPVEGGDDLVRVGVAVDGIGQVGGCLLDSGAALLPPAPIAHRPPRGTMGNRA